MHHGLKGGTEECFVRWADLNGAVVRMWMEDQSGSSGLATDDVSVSVELMTAEHCPGIDLHHEDVLGWESEFFETTGRQIHVRILGADIPSHSRPHSRLIFESSVRARILATWQKWALSA